MTEINERYSEIIPGLFLGDCYALGNDKNLSNNIHRVVNCAFEITNILKLDDEHYLHILLDDTQNSAIKFYNNIENVIKFIDKYPLNESHVYIHCQQGISRSASMVAAYLIHSGIVNTINEAIDFIIKKRRYAFLGGKYQVFRNALEEYFDK